MLRTALVIDGNSEGGKRALEEFDRAIQQAEASTEKLGNQGVKATIGLERLRQAQEAAARTGAELTQEQQRQAIAGTLNTEQMVRSAVGMDRVTASTRAQRAGMQQLSYQINDVATMFAMGAKPQQIFASQSGQVLQAVQMLMGGTSRFATFMMGPWGMALSTGTILLATLGGEFLSSARDADVFTEALRRQETQADQSAAALQRLLALQKSSLEGDIVLTEIELNKRRDKASQLEIDIQKKSGGRLQGDGRTPMFAYSEYKELQAVRWEIIELEGAIGRGNSALEAREKAERDAAAKTKEHGKAAGETAKAVSDSQKAYDKAFDGAQTYITGLELEIAKIGLTAAALRQLEVDRARDAAATGDQKARIDELNRAREDALALDTARSASKGLSEETAALGLTATELKEREAATASNAAAIAALTASSEEARAALLAESRAILDNFLAWEARTAELENQDYAKNVLEPLRREAQAVGLVGWERERLLAQLESEAELRPLLLRLEEAERAGNERLAKQLRTQIDQRREVLGLQVQMGDYAEARDRETEALRRQNAELEEMARLLTRIGGAGDMLGSVLAIASGNYNAIASGPGGDLLAFVLGMGTGKTDDKGVAILLGDELRDIFGREGLFSKTLKENLQAGGIGTASSFAVFGDQGATGQFMSFAGGVLGQKAGEAMLGKMLGGFAGPVGSIVGGLLGGAVAGLISGPAKGSVTIGGSGDDFSVLKGRGKDSEMLANAGKAAGSITTLLEQLAGELGGTVDAARASVSIGQRKGNWVVDTQGRGNTTGSGVLNFGADAEAAITAAVEDLIRDGVLHIERASTMAILKGAGNLEEKLQKALIWEGLFTDLEAETSPFTAELKALQAQLASISEIAREAGASTEELAKVQEWMVRQQQQLINQAMASYRSTFYSDAENAAFAKQTISNTLTPLGHGNVKTVAQYRKLVESTDPLANPELFGALMELSDEFAVLKNAAEAAAQAVEAENAARKALAAQRGQIEAEILRLQGKEAEALAKERALQLEAADASIRGLLRELHQVQDIADAKQNLFDAYERERSEHEQTIETMDRSIEQMQEYRDRLFQTAGSDAGNTQRAFARLDEIATKARAGDAGAMAKLPGAGDAYIEAATANASSIEDVRRAIALVARLTDDAIGAAGDVKDNAQLQLDLNEEQVGQLIDLNENVLSVRDAIIELQRLQGGTAAAGGSSTQQQTQTETNNERRHKEVRDQLKALRDRIGSGNDLLEQISKVFSRVEQAGFFRVRQIDA